VAPKTKNIVWKYFVRTEVDPCWVS